MTSPNIKKQMLNICYRLFCWFLKINLSNKLYNIFEFYVEDYETFHGKYSNDVNWFIRYLILIRYLFINPIDISNILQCSRKIFFNTTSNN